MLRTVVLLLFSSQAFAAAVPPNSYMVEVQLVRANQPTSISHIRLMEGEDGAIMTNSGPQNHSLFSAIVHKITDEQLNLSYRVKQTLQDSKLDFARADIALKPNLPLVVSAQDDNEDEVEIRVTVTKD